jgi:hypothetical protein
MAKERSFINPLSRREVLKFGAYATVGGVLTPGISRAQAIMTDTKGITARDIQLNVAGTMIPGYEARPEAMGRYPIIATIAGFTGNSEHHRDVVRRFAKEGFYAISPELFHREGGMQGKTFPEMARISGAITRAQYLGDGDALRHRVPGRDGGGAVVRPPRAQVQGLRGGCVQPGGQADHAHSRALRRGRRRDPGGRGETV